MGIRLQLCGPSGVGKTTLAKELSTGDMPFISCSYSDGVKRTRDMKQVDMLNIDSKTMMQDEYQNLSYRQKMFTPISSRNGSYVSDRSYVDNFAYFTSKLAAKVSKCDVNSFFHATLQVLLKDTTHLVVIPLTDRMAVSMGGSVEDNGKRITSAWFQVMMSNIILGALNSLGYKENIKRAIEGPEEYSMLRFGEISIDDNSLYPEQRILVKWYKGLVTKVMIMYDIMEFKNRVDVVNKFINDQY